MLCWPSSCKKRQKEEEHDDPLTKNLNPKEEAQIIISALGFAQQQKANEPTITPLPTANGTGGGGGGERGGGGGDDETTDATIFAKPPPPPPSTATITQSKATFYPCLKIQKHTGLRSRRYILLPVDSKGTIHSLFIFKQSRLDLNLDSPRSTSIINIKATLNDESLTIEFVDHCISPLIVTFEEEQDKATREKKLEDLRERLTPNCPVGVRKNEIEEVLSDLTKSIPDAVNDHFFNLSNSKFSIDGTRWCEIRHEIDGSKIYSAPSVLPSVPRLKSICYINCEPEQMFNMFSNFVIRGSFDTSLKLGSVLKEWKMGPDNGDGAKLQLVRYKMAGREFLEVSELSGAERGGVVTESVTESGQKSECKATNSLLTHS